VSEATGRGKARQGVRARAVPSASLSPGFLRPVPRPTGEGRRALGGRGPSQGAFCELGGFFFFGGVGWGECW
jgi:hypothetical protein